MYVCPSNRRSFLKNWYLFGEHINSPGKLSKKGALWKKRTDIQTSSRWLLLQNTSSPLRELEPINHQVLPFANRVVSLLLYISKFLSYNLSKFRLDLFRVGRTYLVLNTFEIGCFDFLWFRFFITSLLSFLLFLRARPQICVQSLHNFFFYSSSFYLFCLFIYSLYHWSIDDTFLLRLV